MITIVIISETAETTKTASENILGNHMIPKFCLPQIAAFQQKL